MVLRLELFFFIAAITVLCIAAFQKNNVWMQEITLWQDAVKKSPLKARPHTNVGLVYDKEGNLDKAEDEYKRAIQLEPDYLGPYGPLAVIYGKQGDIDKAIEIFLWVIPRLPEKDYKVHTGLGVAYMIKGLLKEAEEEFHEALRINPNYEIAHYNLAELYGKIGLRDKTLKHWEEYLKLVPPDEPFRKDAVKHLERLR